MKKTLISTAIALTAVLTLSSCNYKECPTTSRDYKNVGDKSISIKFNNADFYDADGTFNVAKGKEAVITMMKYHGYPVYDGIRKDLWVSDYGTGKYTEVGLAARMWVNNVKDKYMLMDLFMLPNQMLPEHWHLAGVQSGVKVPAKNEGWLIRYGSSHVMGEGPNNMTFKVPMSHNGGKVTVYHDTFCKAGEFAKLNATLAHHWQMAGPEGAIITETANCHCDKGVRHLDSGINKNFLGE